MRAVTIRAYGGPERVSVEDVPRPVPQDPLDVIIAVKAAALNHLDLFVVNGLPGVTHEFPHVLGADGAGVVEAVGPAVRTVRSGDTVLINPGISCLTCAFCTKGEHGLCSTYDMLGEHRPGTLAEAVRVPESSVAKLPGKVSWTEAAAFPLVTLTAWRMLKTRAALQPGETVLIWGIGGGVALAALQIAKLLGGRAIVTSSSDEKLERARSLGADETINHRSVDVAKEVRRLTEKRGAEIVVDSVGTATWETSLRAIARGGRLVTCGGTSGPMVQMDIRRLFWHQYSILGSTMGNHAEFAEIAAHFGAGRLRPVVDHVYPLGEARAAFERMAKGEQFGKLVVEIG
ncbi:MAG: zinc-binding dehydrogenase [Gemmatimonadales bacterium]